MTQNLSALTQDRFFVVGAMKSGTTTICHLLDQHPAICFSKPYEANFFTKNYDNGWNWYDNLFDVQPETILLGDGSVGYSKHQIHPGAPGMIAENYPDAKIIYIVREPLDRIRSQWSHMVRIRKEHLELDEAVRANPNYVHNSRYFAQIGHYREVFNDDQILILFTEDLRHHPASQLEKCIQFLELPPTENRKIEIVDQHISPANITLEARALQSLKNVPGKNLLAFLAPAWFKRGIKSFFRKEITAKPQWTDETICWLRKELDNDTRAFLEYAGKPADYWRKD